MRAAFLALALLLITPVTARASCPGCSTGTQTLGAPGADIPFDGRVRLGLAARTRTVDYGGITLDEERLDAMASWAPIAALILTADVPVVRRAATDGSWTAGLGNAQASARLVVLRDRCLAPRHMLSFTGGLLFPAPSTPGTNGTLSSLVLAPGAPAAGATVGLAYVGHAGDLALLASVGGIAWLDGPGRVRLGPSLVGSVALLWQVTPAVGLRIASDARFDAVSQGTLGMADPDSGGFVLSAGPDLVFQLGDHALLWLGARLPVLSVDTGARVEGLSLSASVVLDV